MRQHAKQAVLACALTLPMVLTAVFSGPFTMETVAQANRMVSPQTPILLDNGDGQPGAGDTPINPTLGGISTLELPRTFSCGTQANNTVTLGSADGSGRFRTGTRTNNSRTQAVNITGTAGGGATQFTLTETLAGVVRAQGTGTVLDSNGDGVGDSFSIAGTRGSALVSMVFTPTSSYVSIPASQAAMLGARQGRCGPAVGQIFVPLADTNGDGRGDTIIFDLDGNGVPDPQFYMSPPLGGASVPTMNSTGLAVLTLLLGATGVWYLGRRRLDGDPGTV